VLDTQFKLFMKLLEILSVYNVYNKRWKIIRGIFIADCVLEDTRKAILIELTLVQIWLMVDGAFWDAFVGRVILFAVKV